MRDWNKENLIDFVKGESAAYELFGDYLKSKIEKSSLEIQVENLSESIINKIDEGLVANFDYSDESLEAIEDIIDDAFRGSEEVQDDNLIEDLAIDIGSYLSLTILENIGGEWRFRKDFLHSSIYFKTIDAECFPFHRVVRRLLEGRSESLADFYLSILEGLGVVD